MKRSFLVTFAAVYPFLLIGCGTAPSSQSGCTVSSALVSVTSDGSPFQAVFVRSSLRIFPGQTVPVDVRLNPLSDTHDPVTVSLINLPDGFTVSPVTAPIGTTAHLRLHASPSAAYTCFTAVQGILQAELVLTADAVNVAGRSTDQAEISVQLDDPRYKPTKTDLPVVSINTAGSAPVDQEDDYVSGSMSITDASNPSNNYTGTLGIKGHGNSTWAMPKKPYRLKLDNKSKLLGMKSSKNWILLANYSDKSLLRTDIAFHVANIFGMAWTPATAFAEVYLNGEYEGVYQISEKVEVADNRLNIGEMSEDDNSGDNLTGGYLGEIDNYFGATYTFRTPSGLPISLDDPDPPTTPQATYFVSTVKSAENSLYSANFTSTMAGWRAHFDEASLVNWFLTEEFMGNEDADFWSSDYFYKPRGNSLLYMGPVWDFDVSSGNVNYTTIKDPDVPWVSTRASWYVRLMHDTEFVAAVKKQWAAKRTDIGDINTYIDSRSTALTQGAHNNYLRWRTLGVKVWPNVVALGSYEAEVDYLKDWLAKRTAYMDATYGK
ncbi:MAG: CotH kinase family protein [Acidobacteria bacterium]|nr:CotH kinase family protein [Acidobacteriota bacterium]